MARPDKVTAVAELTESFRSSTATILTEYRGLTVAELAQLRGALAGNATYSVVKNTLSTIAAREAGLDSLVSMLSGPSAIAFVSGDPVEAAKGLRSFGREHPMLVVKGGVLDGKPLTAEEIRALADLESREVLLAKLAGGLAASLQQAVSLFAAPLSQAARLLAALAAKAEEDPSVLRGSDGAATTETVADAAAEPAPDAAAPAGSDETAADAATTSDPTSDQSAAPATDEPTPPTTSDSDGSEPADPAAG